VLPNFLQDRSLESYARGGYEPAYFVEVRMCRTAHGSQAAGMVMLGVLVCSGLQAADCGQLPNTGRFKVGAELGEERTGFSGRLKVTIFTSLRDPHWPSIEQCLLDPIIEPEMEYYVGVLVDETADMTQRRKPT
jgi:hypothetical protein